MYSIWSFHYFSIPSLGHSQDPSVPMKARTTMENLQIWVALVACWNVSLQQGHLSDVLLKRQQKRGKKYCYPTFIKGDGRGRQYCLCLYRGGRNGSWYLSWVYRAGNLVKASRAPPCFLKVKSAITLHIQVVCCLNVLYRVRLFCTNKELSTKAIWKEHSTIKRHLRYKVSTLRDSLSSFSLFIQTMTGCIGQGRCVPFWSYILTETIRNGVSASQHLWKCLDSFLMLWKGWYERYIFIYIIKQTGKYNTKQVCL